MAKYLVTLYNVQDKKLDGYSAADSFVVDNVPCVGLIYCHDGYEWEVLNVRQHIRKESSDGARNRAPHIVDVLVREMDGIFTISGGTPSAYRGYGVSRGEGTDETADV